MPSGPLLTGGASGATLRLGVAKFGSGAIGARVATQGLWLKAHQDIPCLPRVAVSWPAGYVMEPLEPIDWSTVDYEAHIVEAVDLLEQQVWSRPAECPLDLDAHLRFVRARCEVLPGVWPALEAWAHDIEWPPPVLIHGDPTFVNQVRRQTDLVFLDPNPATPVCPSVRAQDLAHLAQSLHGYEAITFGYPRPTLPVEALQKLSGADDAEWDVVRYLTAVKFVRILTYDSRPELRDIAAGLVAAR
jgi:hypothetical protein